MKILLDDQRCTGLGMCEALAPEHFEIADDGSLLLLSTQVAPADRDDVAAAVASCPTEALRLVEDD